MAGRVTFEVVPEPERRPEEAPEPQLSTVDRWTGEGVPAWAEVRTEPCVTLSCSKCGDANDGDFTPHYDSIDDALQGAFDADWVLLSDGRLLCIECSGAELCAEVGGHYWEHFPEFRNGTYVRPEEWHCRRCNESSATEPPAEGA